MLTRAVCLLAVLLAATAPEPRSAAAQSSSANTRLHAYHALLTAYHAGDSSPVAQLARWPVHDVDTVLEQLATPQDPQHVWETWRFEAAAMLQTDTAIAWSASDPQRGVEQLLRAQDILAKGGRTLTGFRVSWAAAAASWLRRHQQTQATLQLLDRARHDLGDQPVLLYEVGITHELEASGYTNMAASGLIVHHVTPGLGPRPSDLLSPTGRPLLIPDAQRASDRAMKTLEVARGPLEQAVRGLPDATLPRLHLARVLLLLGQYDAALDAVRDLMANEKDKAASYLASLLAGAVEERRGRLDDAASRYQQAIDRFPAGQFAYVALAEVDLRAGRFDAAQSATAAMLARPSTGPLAGKEPWWYFAWENADGVDDVFADVRAEARR